MEKTYESSHLEEPLYVSEQDYWDHYYEHPDHRYEWNNGNLEKKSMADFLSVEMYRWIMQLLGEYLKENPLGRIMALEMGFRMNVGPQVTIRKPDLAVVLHDNPTKADLLDRSYRGICDICIEFISDSTPRELERDLVDKKAEYESSGVREYYIFDRLHKHTAFYELQTLGQGSNSYQPMNPSTGIIQSKVLPGFAFKLEHLKTLPLLETLVDDSIYQGYLMKFFQDSKRREEEERKAKEQERQAKEKAQRDKGQAERREEEERRAKGKERQAKEKAQKAKEQAEQREAKERKAKEKALQLVDREREAKEQAEQQIIALKAELERLKG